MKPRRVIITLEVETDVPIKDLKDKGIYRIYAEIIHASTEIKQVQVNVVKEGKK